MTSRAEQHQTVRLLEQIRARVAELHRLDQTRADRSELQQRRREITRLQWRQRRSEFANVGVAGRARRCVVVGANEFERRRWNDERWAALWPRRERLTDKVTAYLLAALALRPGERVLEVGSGGGKAALAAADAIGSTGAVVGADLSAPLNRLAEQRAREASANNVGFCLADVQTDKLEGGPFDVAMSQFGVMFFDEPIIAFANIRAHLKREGRIVFACWQSSERNPWFFAPAVAPFVPPPPEPEPGKSPTGPFALADPEQTTAILQAAGFTDVRRTPHEIEVEAPEDSIVDEAQLALMGVPEEKLSAAKVAVDEHMQRFRIDAQLSRFPLAFQIFQASNR